MRRMLDSGILVEVDRVNTEPPGFRLRVTNFHGPELALDVVVTKTLPRR